MRPPLCSRFVDKAEAALAAAVEIYNKPAFAYREETFALLAINAWELLLKAKVLKENGNNPRAIRVYKARKTKDGKLSKKLYLQRNRTGNPKTISLGACVVSLDREASCRLSPAVKANLDALVEIRDNAAHFVNASAVLAKQVLEIGSASIKNFIILANRWFERDFSRSLSLILPLSFIGGTAEAEVVPVSSDESKLIEYLRSLAQSPASTDSTFSIAIRLQVKLERSHLDTASKVVVTNDPGATKVTLSEEDIRAKYPWDYRELTKRLMDRYRNFKQDSRFHSIRKPLLSDPGLAMPRFLDPANPKSIKKDFYNPNVVKIFDKHYQQKFTRGDQQ